MLQAMNRREHSRVSQAPKGHERADDIHDVDRAGQEDQRTLKLPYGTPGCPNVWLTRALPL
jgi:hypothetical protein